MFLKRKVGRRRMRKSESWVHSSAMEGPSNRLHPNTRGSCRLEIFKEVWIGASSQLFELRSDRPWKNASMLGFRRLGKPC